MKKYIDSGKIKFKEKDTGSRGFYFKTYKNEISEFKSVNSLFAADDGDEINYKNEVGTRDAKDLFGDNLFNYPKPVVLIKKLIKYSAKQDAIILDFFSTSAATAQAVMTLNKEEGANNSYILVQTPNKVRKVNNKNYNAALKFLSESKKPPFNVELSKERIRRAGDKIKEEAENENLDIGFKVFRLNTSNFSLWQPNIDKEKPLKSLVRTLDNNINNILPDRTKWDVLYEILIKEGLELTVHIKEIQENLFSIESGQYIVCLKENMDENILNEIINECNLNECHDSCVIFLEKCFNSNDSLKSNIKEKLKYYAVQFKTL